MILWDDSDTRFKEVYFDWLKSYGINSIMLDFGWNKLEPTKGAYDQNYLGMMDRFIQKAKARGIYVTLRMHKWSYPDAYQSQELGNAWLLGYPVWLKNTPDFWENVGNCWDNYVAMWTMLATRYKNEPYVAGFDLFGEPGNDVGPGIYDSSDQDWLTWNCNTGRKVMGVLFDKDRLYERTINAIHSIGNKLVIIESFGGANLKYIKTPGAPPDLDKYGTLPQRPQSQGFAVGQSVYEWFHFDWLDGQKADTDSWNVPLLATEFGVEVAIIDSPEPNKVAWVEQARQAFAAKKLGWFYWGFGPGPNNDFSLVHETDDSVSPILSSALSTSVSVSARLASTNSPTAFISGGVRPSPSDPASVKLEYSDDGGASYQEIARITTAADGAFNYSWRIPHTGMFMIRADAQGLESPPFSVEIGSGIPGFPSESLLIGGALGILFVALGKKRGLSRRRRGLRR
jgi:hypothetical protein